MIPGITRHDTSLAALILYIGGYVQYVPFEPDEPGAPGFWDVLAYEGISKDMVLNATSRIIHASSLKPMEADTMTTPAKKNWARKINIPLIIALAIGGFTSLIFIRAMHAAEEPRQAVWMRRQPQAAGPGFTHVLRRQQREIS